MCRDSEQSEGPSAPASEYHNQRQQVSDMYAKIAGDPRIDVSKMPGLGAQASYSGTLDRAFRVMREYENIQVRARLAKRIIELAQKNPEVVELLDLTRQLY